MGQGDNKVQKAIEHALNHPLLESINLQHAKGILVNITAGTDLTFSELVDALNDLQEKTNNQAEIIPGIINDPRIGDRVQVIMILTGLGATPIEISSLQQRAAVTSPARKPDPTSLAENIQPETHSVEYASMQADLDIPAFLRRRPR
jgi:cell division protein FtsZ